jgi:hypothetical protein
MTTTPRCLSLVAFVLALGPAAALDAQETPGPTIQGYWSGPLRPVLFTAARAGSLQARYTGTVEVSPSTTGGDGVFRVTIRVSSNRGTEIMEWGISLGRCGSKLIFLVPANQLPQIMIHGGGDGDVDYEGPFNLDTNSSFQLGVFSGGHLQQNMVTCADLKYKSPGK